MTEIDKERWECELCKKEFTNPLHDEETLFPLCPFCETDCINKIKPKKEAERRGVITLWKCKRCGFVHRKSHCLKRKNTFCMKCGKQTLQPYDPFYQAEDI